MKFSTTAMTSMLFIVSSYHSMLFIRGMNPAAAAAGPSGAKRNPVAAASTSRGGYHGGAGGVPQHSAGVQPIPGGSQANVSNIQHIPGAPDCGCFFCRNPSTAAAGQNEAAAAAAAAAAAPAAPAAAPAAAEDTTMQFIFAFGKNPSPLGGLESPEGNTLSLFHPDHLTQAPTALAPQLEGKLMY